MRRKINATSHEADPRLQRLLGGETLAPLRRRLRKHFERIGVHEARTPSVTRLRLNNLEPVVREALALLSGRPVNRSSRSIELELSEIDRQLEQAGLAHSLRDALERLDGPIISRRAEREALEARWHNSQAHLPPDSPLYPWLHDAAAQRLLRRLARDPSRVPSLLDRTARVLKVLPCPPQPRSQLAAQLLGDAHALDNGRPVATLILAAWLHREQQGDESWPANTAPLLNHRPPWPHEPIQNDTSQPPTSFQPDPREAAAVEERQRDIWARAGVLVNELARPALSLNLPTDPRSTWRSHAGEPAYLSLRQLMRKPPAWQVANRIVHVCENPNLLAIAADRLGDLCPPLVCTDGMPAAAQRTLLEQLRQAGAHLLYHGDFDWPGIQIANVVMRRWQAEPWRMRAADYEEAARRSPPSTPLLHGNEVPPCWDAGLLTAMQTHRLAIAEEAVAETLLTDLQTCSETPQIEVNARKYPLPGKDGGA